MISYTVDRALTIPCLRTARLVAGKGGLGRAVEAVAVLDVTDFAGVRSNQLVLSNAYPLLDFDLRRLVDRLTKAQASALVLILSEYWREAPAALIEAADEAAFPVFVLPEVPFDEIVNPLLTAIAGHQLDTLRQSTKVHDALTRAALQEEGDPSSVVHILARALRRPTGVFTERGELVASSGPSDAWTSDELITHIQAHIQGGAASGTLVVGAVDYYIASAPTIGKPSATVCVRDIDPRNPLARAAIAHAAVVAGMLLVGRRQVEEVYRKYERELLEDLVDGRLIGQEETRTRAAQIGWPLDRPYLVLAAGPARRLGASPGGTALALSERDLASLARVLRENAIDGRMFLRPPGLGLVLHLQARDDPATQANDFASTLAGADQPPWDEPSIVLGAGRPRQDVTALSNAFSEAKLALQFREHGHRIPGKLTHFSDLGVIGLLSLADNPKRALDIAYRVLGPLADPRLPRRSDLLVTLGALLSRNMNLRRTADDLFFHYNTIRHRLQRLQTLLKDGLDDHERRLLISMAVATVRLFESAHSKSGPAG